MKVNIFYQICIDPTFVGRDAPIPYQSEKLIQ